jgi:cation transport ATPase
MKTLDLSYTKEDIEKAFDLHYNKQFPFRSKLLLILGVILLLTAFVFVFVHVGAFPSMKWIFALMGIFYIGFYFYRKRTMVNLAMKNPTIRDMCKIELTEAHIRFSGEKGYSVQEWDKFNEIHSDEFSTLLYLSKHNFFILPSRCLEAMDKSFIEGRIKS